MKKRASSILVGISVLMLSAAGLSTAAPAPPSWGDTVGPVSAVVERIDTDRGLTVRSGPSPESEVISYLAVGTKINGFNEFTRGWMRLRTPFEGGWVHINYLVPEGGTAEVISVDEPAGCLNIRSGPSSSYPRVGCAGLGEEIVLTGVWSENNWAEVAQPDGAWVFAGQIRTALHPTYRPKTRVVRELTYEDEPLPYYDFDEPSVVYNYIYRYPPLYWADRYWGFNIVNRYWPHRYYGYWPHRYKWHKGYKYWGKRHPKHGVVIGGKRGGYKFGRYAHHKKNVYSRGRKAYSKYRSYPSKNRRYNIRTGRGRKAAVRSANVRARVSPKRAVSVRSGRGFGTRVSSGRRASVGSGRGFRVRSAPRRAAAVRAGNIGGTISSGRSARARIGSFRGGVSRGSGFRSGGFRSGGFRGGFGGRRRR